MQTFGLRIIAPLLCAYFCCYFPYPTLYLLRIEIAMVIVYWLYLRRAFRLGLNINPAWRGKHSATVFCAGAVGLLRHFFGRAG
jgi:hypothetical protein